MSLSISQIGSQTTKEINADLTKYQRRLIVELARATPENTGRAMRGWVAPETPRVDYRSSGKTFAIARNDVPYIGILDKGSSSQAPNGIVKPVLDKLNK
jgi:hypothetical protein